MLREQMDPLCRATIVIPCLNEALQIQSTLPNILDAVQTSRERITVETIVVDGGSEDGTAEVLQSLQQQYESFAVITETRRGIGYARKAGARLALARAAARHTVKHDDFWIINTDADTDVPASWLGDWCNAFASATALLIGGRSQFPLWFRSQYPNANAVFDQINQFTELAAMVFGPIKFDGHNSAIERKAYAAVGPFTQPVRLSAMGAEENLAGEDWDLGKRARYLGLEVAYSDGAPVAISPRRLLYNPSEFFTCKAYDKEFLRVEASPVSDIDAGEFKRWFTAMRDRYITYLIENPLTLDSELLNETRVIEFLGASLAAEIRTWIQSNPRLDIFERRNEFIFEYLGKFHQVFGGAITDKLSYLFSAIPNSTTSLATVR
jgi:glycosyltransferase involved in cell wall biosynthesis